MAKTIKEMVPRRDGESEDSYRRRVMKYRQDKRDQIEAMKGDKTGAEGKDRREILDAERATETKRTNKLHLDRAHSVNKAKHKKKRIDAGSDEELTYTELAYLEGQRIMEKKARGTFR